MPRGNCNNGRRREGEIAARRAVPSDTAEGEKSDKKIDYSTTDTALCLSKMQQESVNSGACLTAQARRGRLCGNFNHLYVCSNERYKRSHDNNATIFLSVGQEFDQEFDFAGVRITLTHSPERAILVSP